MSLVLLLVACGGKSSGNEASWVNGGSGSAGPSSAGAGGSGTPGAAAGGSGSSAGASVKSPCTGPSEDGAGGGVCLAAFPNWTHDELTGVCRPIIYSGCDGTENNYQSLADCQAACPARAPDYDACQQDSDCMVMPSRCCGCFGQEFTAHDLIAFNQAHFGTMDTCGGRDVACTPCPDEPDSARKFFKATCVKGQCAVLDLRESSLTACETPADCKLRRGSHCCPACTEGDDVIAVRRDGSFEAQACGGEHPGCPECESRVPENAVTTCVNGHCGVAYVGASPP